MAAPPDYIAVGDGAVLLRIFVQPRAAKDELVGVHGDALKLKVRAIPENGKANAAACRLLGELLDIPSSRIDVVAGGTSRYKKVALTDADAARVAERLETLLERRGGR